MKRQEEKERMNTEKEGKEEEGKHTHTHHREDIILGEGEGLMGHTILCVEKRRQRIARRSSEKYFLMFFKSFTE